MPDHYPDSEKTTSNPFKRVQKFLGIGVGGGFEKRIGNNEKKITHLKNIIKLRKENVDKKLDGGSSSGLLDALNGINNNVNGMLSIMSDRQRFESKRAADERKEAEKAARAGSEKKLEGSFKGIKKIGESVIAPAISIWQRLWDFIKTILLGKVVLKLFDWLTDPENQDKIKAIGRLFKDWWPAMLTGFVLFGTGIGRFITWMGAKLVSWGWTLLKTVIPVLWKAITAMGPWGVAALAVGGTAAYLATRPNETDEKVDKSVEEQGAEETAAQLREQQENRNPLQRFGDFVTGAGQEREEQIQRVETGTEKRYGFFGELDRPAQKFAEGGFVQSPDPTIKPVQKFAEGGQVRGPSGVDKVPAQLTAGEFVMSKGAVQKWGVDTLAGMNAAGGGTNKPTFGYSTGGPVLNTPIHFYKNGGEVKGFSTYDDPEGEWQKEGWVEMDRKLDDPSNIIKLKSKATPFIPAIYNIYNSTGKYLGDKTVGSKLTGRERTVWLRNAAVQKQAKDLVKGSNTDLVKVVKGSDIDKTKVNISSTPTKSLKQPVSPPPNKQNINIKALYDQQKASQQQQTVMPAPDMRLPPINPSAMISKPKITVLGISV